MQNFSNRPLALITAVLAGGLLAWDVSALDLVTAHWFGGPDGFPWREHVFLQGVMHDGARLLAWLLSLALCLTVWWPAGVLRRLSLQRRLQLATSPLAAVLVISALKSWSTTPCPWSLAEFGSVAHYSSHWQHWLTPDGGAGRCFPAGHAASGFAFVGGYFAFRSTAPRVARLWLVCALLAGGVLGLAQQIRGAHFSSHTLWTAFICWCVAWAVDGLFAHGVLAPSAADVGDLA